MIYSEFLIFVSRLLPNLLTVHAYMTMCTKFKAQPAIGLSCLATHLLQSPPGLRLGFIKAVIPHDKEIESGLGMWFSGRVSSMYKALGSVSKNRKI